MSQDPLRIELRKVSKVYRHEGAHIQALEDITFAVPDGKFVTLVGPSGCGKSTLLNLIAGFERPTSGEILLNGKAIEGPAPDRGFVFQDYALFPWKTVLGNIMFGLRSNGRTKREAREIAMQYVELVNLQGFENAYPHTLSGGMKQRVAIARALAYEPDVLLMDEPFGALDAQTKKYMQGELVRIWERLRKTVIFVTHSVIEATFLSDIIVVMTARPGTVKHIFESSITRPRDYVSDAYISLRKRVLTSLEEEVDKEIRMDRP